MKSLFFPPRIAPAMLLTALIYCGYPLILNGQGPPAPQTAPVAVNPDQASIDQAAAESKLWMERVKAGNIKAGLDAWSPAAFKDSPRAEVESKITASLSSLGRLLQANLLLDRSLVDEPPVLGPGKAAGMTTVTTTWFCRYENGAQREFVVLRSSGKDPLKIIGVRHQEAAVGKQAAVDLASDIGQMVLLRLSAAPRTRWEPFLEEAKWLAGQIKVQLPPIPMEDALPGEGSDEEGTSPLMSLLTAKVDAALAPSGKEVQAAGRMLLLSYALLAIYAPGQTLCAKLAGIVGESARFSKLPDELWQPLIKAVIDKEPRSAVSEIVHTMALEISAHFAAQERGDIVAARAGSLLREAMKNMAALTYYQVRAEITSGDKTARLEAALDLGFMDLRLTGFDGKKQCRQVTPDDGARISLDDGITWTRDTDTDTAVGLCRTLTSPVDPGYKVADNNTFTITGEEEINGEKLLHVARTGQPETEPMEYWILVSKRGPVVRRARVTMNFGDLKAIGTLTYTKLRGYADAAAAEAARKAVEHPGKPTPKLPEPAPPAVR